MERAQAGVAWEMLPWLTVGASYRGGFRLQIDQTFDIAGDIVCPVQFHYAENDGNIPLDAVERVRLALPQSEVHVYPGSTHGFNCWARGSYHAPSAALLEYVLPGMMRANQARITSSTLLFSRASPLG